MARPLSEVLADPIRLAAVRRVRRVTVGPTFDRLAELAATVLDAPVGMVNLVGAEQQHLVGGFGLPEPLAAERTLPTTAGFCQYALTHDGPLLLDDVRCDERYTRLWVYRDAGLLAYAGTPLLDGDGQPVGTLCVVDRRPRRWRERDRRALEALAHAVMSEVSLYRDVDRRDRLLEAFQAAPVAVAVTSGPEHRIEYLNPTYREVFGDRPVGVPGREAFPELEPQGFFELMDGVLASGDTVRVEEAPVAFDVDGDGVPGQHWFTFSYSAILGPEGTRSGVLVVAAEVSAAVRARHELERSAARQAALARATAAVNRSLDPQAELAALVRAVVPALADVCTVNLLDHPVRLGQAPPLPVVSSRVAAAHRDPWADLVPSPRAGLLRTGEDLLTEAIRAGRTVRASLDEQAPPKWAAAVGLSGLLASAGMHTAVCSPVTVSGMVVAVVGFLADRERPPYTDEDLTALRQIAVQAGVALGHGMAYQRTREAALALQRSMLTTPPVVAGLRLAVRYRPAGAEAEVGGDWYDAFAACDGGLGVAIGDVAGHDIAAAAAMGQLRSMLRALALETGRAPAEVVTGLDRLATGLGVTSFTTLVYGRLRRDGAGWLLRWANAGHPPPVLLEPGGRPRLLTEAAGLVLGVRADTPRLDAEARLVPGATLLLHTDGLVERHGSTPDDLVLDRVAGLADAGVEELCDGLLGHAPPHDDVALLAVRVE